MNFIPFTIFWVVWKEINRTFEGVDDTNGFNILKNRWFETLDFFLYGHLLVTMENFAELVGHPLVPILP